MGLITPLLCRYTDRLILAEITMVTSGIYKLNFLGTQQVYIGQSINIEHRFRQHINSLLNNTANFKMLKAFALHGLPSLEILCECTPDELDDLETEAIQIFNSVEQGLNIFYTSTQTPQAYGEAHGCSLYTNEQIIAAATLLTNPSNKAKWISEKTGVSIDVIYDIARLKSHSWIKNVVPEIYNKIFELRGTRKNPKTLADRGTIYPPVQCPSGNVYKDICNLKQFCEQHNLSRSNFRRLLKGISKTCTGWKLAYNG